MCYLSIIYVLSMYYLCIISKWEPNGYRMGSGGEPEVKDESCRDCRDEKKTMKTG